MSRKDYEKNIKELQGICESIGSISSMFNNITKDLCEGLTDDEKIRIKELQKEVEKSSPEALKQMLKDFQS